MLGDGGITPFQTTITLGYKADRKYSEFLHHFLLKLFQMKPAVYYRKKSTITLQFSSKEFVHYCVSLGLCIGNKVKQEIDMPDWVKKNKDYLLACIRGLMDTDGCIFQECHKIKTKRYCYPRLTFVSYSQPLRVSVHKALKKLDFFPNIRNNRAVTLERRDDIIRYFTLIGTHNPKHKKRYESFVGGVRELAETSSLENC